MILPERDLLHVLEHMGHWESLRGKRIFITGASGFVGTWLCESFEWANTHLGLDAELTKIPRASLPAGDFDLGIHAAKADTAAADMEGIRRILDFAADRHVSRLLFTSSGAVYGTLPIDMKRFSEDFVCNPETSYGQAKLAGEQMCREYPLCSVIARLFAFVGPALPLDANFAIGNFLHDVINSAPIVIKGNGKSRRSYLYAADLAIWLWTLLLTGENARPYNVGSAAAISISELAQTVVVNTVPGTPIRVVGGEGSSIYVPSVERAETELKLQPLISLEEGIRRMYAWNLCAKDREMILCPSTTT